jgi:putative addiction module killer protein
MVTFLKFKEYSDWYEVQTAKIRAQIDGRLEKIRDFGHYGHVKKLSSVLYEIKFNNGNRIYYTEKMINGEVLILILGGNKNGQDKDIKKAQKAAEKIHND